MALPVVMIADGVGHAVGHHGHVTGKTDSNLVPAFEHLLDGLIAALCPDRSIPASPRPPNDADKSRTYRRVNAKRSQVARELRALVDNGGKIPDAVLDAIVCDEDVSANRQLIEPAVHALGRRAVQRHLIATIERGTYLQKVCAVRAWYWSQVTLVYSSPENLRQRQPTAASRARDDEVADLRANYRTACLMAFVSCDDVPTREWLARGFLLNISFFPPNLHDTVARARAIAEADPMRFKDLLARKHDGTNLAAIGRENP